MISHLTDFNGWDSYRRIDVYNGDLESKNTGYDTEVYQTSFRKVITWKC